MKPRSASPRTRPTNRRQFLVHSGLALAAVATGTGCGPSSRQAPSSASPATTAARRPGDGEWDAVREQFALADDYIHMSALYVASHPQPVREAIERHRGAPGDEIVTTEHDYYATQVDAALAAIGELG
ncbi:twin-arginine translocation signal domain-containing protein [Aromatoleum buckelii]|uniref:Twin-arginine translocation signal domain-containing protein n=1 Tax=Aromatoleum buckelii TaxID=200254 RepID=A0ABX1N2A6_9RHOO|nr:twin-arginine translocation signal domain-containing protein [Aromatoleum buckelii]MCK0509878.1 twin-arginine translocation signal domain-containing protein [Aromatoleum buckelii]